MPRPGAQDRDDRDLLAGQHVGGRLGDGRRDRGLGELEPASRLVGLEHGELLDELAELLGPGLGVAQDRQLVLDERMVDHRDVGIRAGRGMLGSSRAAARAQAAAFLQLGVERVLRRAVP